MSTSVEEASSSAHAVPRERAVWARRGLADDALPTNAFYSDLLVRGSDDGDDDDDDDDDGGGGTGVVCSSVFSLPYQLQFLREVRTAGGLEENEEEEEERCAGVRVLHPVVEGDAAPVVLEVRKGGAEGRGEVRPMGVAAVHVCSDGVLWPVVRGMAFVTAMLTTPEAAVTVSVGTTGVGSGGGGGAVVGMHKLDTAEEAGDGVRAVVVQCAECWVLLVSHTPGAAIMRQDAADGSTHSIRGVGVLRVAVTQSLDEARFLASPCCALGIPLSLDVHADLAGDELPWRPRYRYHWAVRTLLQQTQRRGAGQEEEVQQLSFATYLLPHHVTSLVSRSRSAPPPRATRHRAPTYSKGEVVLSVAGASDSDATRSTVWELEPPALGAYAAAWLFGDAADSPEDDATRALRLCLGIPNDRVRALLAVPFDEISELVQKDSDTLWAECAQHIDAAASDAAEARQAVLWAVHSGDHTKMESTYFNGKAFLRVLQLAASGLLLCKEETATPDAWLAFERCMRVAHSILTTLVLNEQPTPLVPDKRFGGVVSIAGLRPGADIFADFGSSVYNDHQYHYGYLIHGAAMYVLLHRAWSAMLSDPAPDIATTGAEPPPLPSALCQWVALLLSDVATPPWATAPHTVANTWNTADWESNVGAAGSAALHEDCAGVVFPRSRCFDWFVAHSWSRGLTPSPRVGKDIESATEEAHAWHGMILWGLVTADRVLTRYGHLLLACLQASVRHYFLLSRATRTGHTTVREQTHVPGILFESKVHYTTWFGEQPEYIHGIQALPFTPCTPLLRSAAFVRDEWLDPKLNLEHRLDTLIDEKSPWASVLLLMKGAIEPEEALERLIVHNRGSIVPDDGLSTAFLAVYLSTVCRIAPLFA